MSNSVGNQKALVANKHIFPTEAFWFPTEFFPTESNNVKFSRMSNSVGNQKALVANKHTFPTEAFWFPTEFNNVKFSREPKGGSSK